MRFGDLRGHRRLIELLVRAVARDALPPSLLFTGPEGVGKATAALAMAALINCETAWPPPADDERLAEWDSCGACGMCRRIARAGEALRQGRGAAVDAVAWLAPDEKASIKIEAVRAVIERAAYRPFDGARCRVVVVDDAHALEPEAQQALLKTLEEPPSLTRLVLVTSRPDALYATIRSRCPQVRFGLLGAADVASVLVERCGWTPEQAASAAAMGAGSVGRVLAEAGGPLAGVRRLVLGVLRNAAKARTPSERLQAAQVLAARGTGEAGEKGRGGATASRPEMALRLDTLAALLRDLGIVTTRADARRLANADLADVLAGLAASYDGDRVVRAFAAVGRARAALDGNVGQKVVADWLAFQL
jgi:DNA polymerase-3 subunit delta'